MKNRSSRRVALAVLLGLTAFAAGCPPPPPWAWHRHHGNHYDRDERHDDRHERRDDRHERHDDHEERR
jgi:hypothetical protein